MWLCSAKRSILVFMIVRADFDHFDHSSLQRLVEVAENAHQVHVYDPTIRVSVYLNGKQILLVTKYSRMDFT